MTSIGRRRHLRRTGGCGLRCRAGCSTPRSIEAFRRREDAGVRAVYREYGRLVYAISLRALGQKHLAEDATQQTFVQAWQAADRFQSRP